MKKINWGIIGCGGIANMFATSLQPLENGKLLAGASRTPGRADEFAQKHGMERVYTDYQSLVDDPDIDAIYVATTHNFHFENVRLCLEHGKHVLCEKPFTVSAAQTRELVNLAREKNLFMMEAVWTRFLPAIGRLQELLAEGIIGQVCTVKVDFSLVVDYNPENRLWKKELAGGALLDLGIYPITFADIVLGDDPERIQSSAVIGRTGVDDRSFYLLDYPGNRTAMLSSSFTCHGPIEATVFGTEGYIRVPHFLGAQQLQIHRNGEDAEFIDEGFSEGENFRFEIAHAMECIEAGKMESDVLPLSKTLSIMETMDTLRAQWGLKYPEE